MGEREREKKAALSTRRELYIGEGLVVPFACVRHLAHWACAPLAQIGSLSIKRRSG